MRRVGFAFVPRNQFGVLDCHVTLPSGEAFYDPMRVFPDGNGCEVVFALRREAGMSDEDFERDAAAVIADLATLKHVLESRTQAGDRRVWRPGACFPRSSRPTASRESLWCECGVSGGRRRGLRQGPSL